MKACIGVALLLSGCLWQGIVERDEHFSFDQSFDRLEFTSWGGDVSLSFGFLRRAGHARRGNVTACYWHNRSFGSRRLAR